MSARLTPKQREANQLLSSDVSNIMLRGGSRSGKTFLLCRAIVQRGLNAPGSRHAIWRFRFNHAKTSIWSDTLPKVAALCFPKLRITFNKTDFYAELPNGSQIWIGGLDDKERVEKVLGQEYCIDPDAKILHSDLTWRRAADVCAGDELIGFPESLEGHCTLEPSMVERATVIMAERLRIWTDRGTTDVSAEHRFVAHYDDRRHRNFRMFSWRMARDLKAGDRIRFAAAPWATDESRDGGWMAGMLDGEGWCSEPARQVGVAQRRGVVLDAMKDWLDRSGVAFGEYASGGKPGQDPCIQLRAKGLWPSLRLLGVARPRRLDGRKLWSGTRAFTNRRDGIHEATVLRIEPLGEGPVVSLSTSTKTLIADGFLGHNCTVYFNESSQIAWGSIETAMSRLAQNVELDPAIAKATGRTHLPLKAYFDCNPPSKLHWSYQLFREKLRPGTKEALPNPGDYVEMKINPDDNRDNLPPKYFEILDSMSAAKRLRFQQGEWATEVNGALWASEDRTAADGKIIPGLDSQRVETPPDMARVVVAVDPSGTKGDGGGDDIGIVAAGIGVDGRGYVLGDATCQLSPDGWGRRAIETFHRHGADRIIGERNFGGAMVEYVIRTADKNVPFREVHASRGKIVRAEPVAALYEQGRVSHVGQFPDLEDQMCNFTANGFVGEGSPDRADALVWALTELMLGDSAIFPISQGDFAIEPFPIPSHFLKGYGFEVSPERTVAIFGAWDKDADVLYLNSEHFEGQRTPSAHASAIKARGDWLIGAFSPAGFGRTKADGERILADYRLEGLNLAAAENSVEAGISAMWGRLSSGRLKVFRGSCQNWLAEHSRSRRDQSGKVEADDEYLLGATRSLVLSIANIMRTRPVPRRESNDYAVADRYAGY